MKVKIGKFPSRLVCNIHDRYMEKRYGFCYGDNQNLIEHAVEKLEGLVQNLYTPINFLFFDRREQKVKVRIDPWDTWSMDSTLAEIIVPMLQQIRRTKHGSPCVDDEDVPEELRSTNSELPNIEAGEIDDNWHERWNYVLGEMIWAFKQSKDSNWEEQFYKYERDDKEMLGLRLVWEDPEAREAHFKRMKNGHRLFGKYYEALWD